MSFMYTKSQGHLLTCRRSRRFSSVKILSKTAGLIETTLLIEPQWDWKIKVCSWKLKVCYMDHMTKLAVMSMYGKTDLNYSSQGLKGR